LSTVAIAYLGFSFILKPHVLAISVPLPAPARPGWSSTVLESPSIFGKDSSLIQCFCPATGQLISTVHLATNATVDAAIAKARAAQLQWRNTSFKQRAQVLRTLLKFILEHQEDVARVSCRDSGVWESCALELRF
jgi:acyl-CoA reductase-like NAD-dependent aldehyde dehydrogenase